MARPKKGYYTSKGRVPGTTTITGRFKESGGLVHWSHKLAHEPLVQFHNVCNKILVAGLTEGLASDLAELCDTDPALWDYRAVRDSAASAGTLAHEMIEAHLHSADPETAATQITTDEALLVPARKGFANYRKWESGSRVEIVEQETPLVSEEYQFGGTPDAIGLVDGELCLIDWKTSNAIYSDYLMQLAAYRVLWEESNPDRPLVGGFHICRFSKDSGDFSHHYFSELDEAWQMFALLRRAYELDKALKKRVR